MPDPILNISFGNGPANPGPPLAPGKTGYTYTTSLCPAPGEYSIIKDNRNCQSSEWTSIFQDHTFLFNEQALDGYMMVINGYGPFASTYYTDTVNNLCDNSKYLLSAAVRSLGKCTAGLEPINIYFQVTTLTGQIIGSAFTENMEDFSELRHCLGFYFTLPPGESAVIIKIMNRFANNTGCGSKIFLDDIQLRPSGGPKLTVAFTGDPNPVKNICYQNNTSIALEATVAAGYANPAFRWQQSADGGITWNDVPGATNLNYSPSFSVPGVYLWRIRASEAAVINNSNCSMTSNYVTIRVDGIPDDILVSTNSPVCATQPLKFNAQGGASYLWTGPNGWTDNVGSTQIFHSTLADSGTYSVEITSAGGCKITASTYVTIIGTDIIAGPDTTICKGNSVQLQVTAGNTYSWSPANSLSDTSSRNPLATPATSTKYTVKVTDGLGCTATASVNIGLRNSVAVVARFTAPDYICRPSDTTSFNDKSLGIINSWNWNFGNGQTAITQTPAQVKFMIGNSTRSYSVSLAVADTAGCTDTSYHLINVADNCYIAVPTAFTPNGDGKNDYLFPLNAYKAKELLFRVYNRSGQLVWQTKDWSQKWDGSVNGVLQQTGVFVWTLDYKDDGGKKFSLKGTTTLIR